MFASRHGERLMTEIGIDAANMQVNLDSVKAGFGVDLSTDRLTYRELQERRELIQKRMRSHVERRDVRRTSSFIACEFLLLGARSIMSDVCLLTFPKLFDSSW